VIGTVDLKWSVHVEPKDDTDCIKRHTTIGGANEDVRSFDLDKLRSTSAPIGSCTGSEKCRKISKGNRLTQVYLKNSR